MAKVKSLELDPLESANYVKATKNYTAKNEKELSFKTGDVITVIRRPDKEFWKGGLGSKIGLFPVSYVEPTSEPIKSVSSPSPVSAPSSSSPNVKKGSKMGKDNMQTEIERLKKLGLQQQYNSNQIDKVIVPLPSGWEKRLDSYGRIYFVDHNLKRSTFQMLYSTLFFFFIFILYQFL